MTSFKRNWHEVAILLFASLLGLPMLSHGFPYPTHDGELHYLWLKGFHDQLWSGELYPRWLSGMNCDRGSPVFYYYPPVPFYVTSVATFLLGETIDGWTRLGWGAVLALAGSGLMAFHWLKTLTSPSAAFWAAMVYMALPYHLVIDLYQRGAFAELWGFVWLPGLMRASSKLGVPRRGEEIRLAFFHALLLATHPPTAVMFGPLPAFQSVMMARSGNKVRVALVALALQLLGFCLAGVYLVPALTMQDHVQMEVMDQGDMNYRHSFLFRQPSAEPSQFAASLIPITELTTVLAIAAAWIAWRGEREPWRRRSILFWVTTVAWALFMMSSKSDWIYQIFPVLQRIQFPWRFNVVLVLATSALVALAGRRWQEGLSLSRALGWSTGLVAWAWLTLPTLFSSGTVPVGSIDLTERLATSRDAPEYFSRWTSQLGLDSASAGQAKISCQKTERAPVIEAWTARRLRFQVQASAAVVCRLNRYYYPEWRAILDNESELMIVPSLPEGLLQLTIPKGTHEIELLLPWAPSERLGFWISVGAATTCLVLLPWPRKSGVLKATQF